MSAQHACAATESLGEMWAPEEADLVDSWRTRSVALRRSHPMRGPPLREPNVVRLGGDVRRIASTMVSSARWVEGKAIEVVIRHLMERHAPTTGRAGNYHKRRRSERRTRSEVTAEPEHGRAEMRRKSRGPRRGGSRRRQIGRSAARGEATPKYPYARPSVADSQRALQCFRVWASAR